MSWAEVKKINSDISKPLDTLIKELLTKTVQTVDISLSSSSISLSAAATEELSTTVDPTKTVVNLKSTLGSTVSDNINSLSYGIKSDGKTIYAYYTPKGNTRITTTHLVLEAITQG